MPAKTYLGEIVSDKMTKTVIVSVKVPKTHPAYGKKIRWTKKFKARDGLGAKEGDLVRIIESRPYSKEVSWKVVEIVESK